MDMPYKDALAFPREAVLMGRNAGAYRVSRTMNLRLIAAENNSVRLGMPRKSKFYQQYLANLRVASRGWRNGK